MVGMGEPGGRAGRRTDVGTHAGKGMEMSADTELLRRWRSNAAAAGVTLTDEDIARIEARGQVQRVRSVEAIVQNANAREVVPDYLDILSTQPKTQSGERSNG